MVSFAFPLPCQNPCPAQFSFFLTYFYCCSSTVVSIFPSPLPPSQPSPLPTLDPTPLIMSTCPLCMFLKSLPPPPLIPYNYKSLPMGFLLFSIHPFIIPSIYLTNSTCHFLFIRHCGRSQHIRHTTTWLVFLGM